MGLQPVVGPSGSPERMFKAINRLHEDLQPRHARLSRQGCQLGVELRRHADADLRVIAHALAIDAAWRPSRLPAHAPCYTALLDCAPAADLCFHKLRFASRPRHASRVAKRLPPHGPTGRSFRRILCLINGHLCRSLRFALPVSFLNLWTISRQPRSPAIVVQ